MAGMLFSFSSQVEIALNQLYTDLVMTCMCLIMSAVTLLSYNVMSMSCMDQLVVLSSISLTIIRPESTTRTHPKNKYEVQPKM